MGGGISAGLRLLQLAADRTPNRPVVEHSSWTCRRTIWGQDGGGARDGAQSLPRGAHRPERRRAQRFEAALILNVHLHALVLDGDFAADGVGVRFQPVRRLTREDVAS
jgi:hypothetical protein